MGAAVRTQLADQIPEQGVSDPTITQTWSRLGHIGATSVWCLADSHGHWRCTALPAELARTVSTLDRRGA